jgi:hypothetical protein
MEERMIFAGCEDLLTQRDPSSIAPGFFERLVGQARVNWASRVPPRLPSQANWKLRSALDVTTTPGARLEKQLEKAIAAELKDDGWGSAVPTASGLINSRLRQMNIDLVHRIPDGFQFIELKWGANEPVLAALQMMRYAALYMLYRLEPQLRSTFQSNEMLNARRVGFEVLARCRDYHSIYDLQAFESRINHELFAFCDSNVPGLSAEFCFRCFPCKFVFISGMDPWKIRRAVLARHSPFPEIHIQGCDHKAVTSLADWRAHGLPEERRYQWKPGRSACELATNWTSSGTLRVPNELRALLDSHPETYNVRFSMGFIERETLLPCSALGPRCHDLLLLGSTPAGDGVVLSIEAKADESFDKTIGQKIAELGGRRSNFPSRVEWLAQYLFGESAFLDFKQRLLKSFYEEMHYQLLAAVAGVCIEAERHGAKHAILIVHEFRTTLTEDQKMDENSRILNSFSKHLWEKNSAMMVLSDALSGPLEMRSGIFDGVPFPDNVRLFIGKLRTDLSSPACSS